MTKYTEIDRCPTCHRRKRRSNEANARYWLLLHTRAEVPVNGKLFSADQWHLYYKTRYLGADDFKLPNGKVITIPRSTADLDTPEFNEYMEKVEAHMAEHDVYLELAA